MEIQDKLLKFRGNAMVIAVLVVNFAASLQLTTLHATSGELKKICI
jgi:hypothetical protein